MKSQDQHIMLARAQPTIRFAGLPAPLVGFRQDRLSIARFWQSRYHVARRARQNGRGVAAVAMQLLRAIFGTFAIAGGLERRLLVECARPYGTAHAVRGGEVWDACREHAR